MRALSALELLRVWEIGAAEGPVQRALTMLVAACDTNLDTVASLTIGRRDAALLALRERTFGPRMSGVATCPNCGARLELTFDVSEICGEAPAESVEVVTLASDGYDVRFRPPASADLIETAGESDPVRHRQRLLERCLLAALHEGEPVSVDRLPSSVVDAIVEGMAHADPLADVELAVSCSSCGLPWRATFDVVSFFWGEIDAWAGRILREVHTLASAYGWLEREILALSPRRRQRYLEMVSG